MDFDELEELEEDTKVENAAPYVLYEYMSAIPKNFRLPALSDVVPASIQLPKEPERKVCMRVFAFQGAADTVMAWAINAIAAPAWAELAVHEWPGHGSREEENCPASLDKMTDDAFRAILPTLQQHQKSGRFEGAPFAFIGHSIGALIVTTLSKRVKAELGLEPAAVVILDRAPPHMPLFSDYGLERMKADPEGFLVDYVPGIVGNANKHGGEKGAKMKKLWLDDIKLASDTRDVGFHLFSCPLLVLRARRNEELDLAFRSTEASEELKYHHPRRAKIMFSSPESAMDFDFEQYEEWTKWSDGQLSIEDVDSHHNAIFGHKTAQELTWAFLAKVKAVDPPK